MKCPHCDGTGVAAQDFEPTALVRLLPEPGTEEHENFLLELDLAVPGEHIDRGTMADVIIGLVKLGYARRE